MYLSLTALWDIYPSFSLTGGAQFGTFHGCHFNMVHGVLHTVIEYIPRVVLPRR